MPLRRHILRIGTALVVLAPLPAAGAAQGRLHPRWEIPGLDISRDGGWRAKARRVRNVRAQLLRAGDFAALNAPGAVQAAAVLGTIQIPVVLLSYQGVDSVFMRDHALYHALLFGVTPPPGNPYTLRTFYEQMSTIGSNPPLFSMQGQVTRWVQLDSAEVTYTGQPGTCPDPGFPVNPYNSANCNGISSADAAVRMHDGMRQALARVDTGPSGLDFRLFDNDGPDGIANTVDDDGYVDVIMFAHSTQDGACGLANNNHIWSHRWALTVSNGAGGLAFADYVTNDPSARGGFVRVRDYVVQSGLGGVSACDTTQLMPIGTAAHEFGHALGLPDLYDTQESDGLSEGIGEWGLMGAGPYARPHSPARFEAWSLQQLGWATLRSLTLAGTYSLGPAPVSDTIFVVQVQGANPRGEYFLLENRQASQADTALIDRMCARSGRPAGCGGGLLVWHIDDARLAQGLFANQVNTGPIHAVALMQADGLNQLRITSASGNRGDAGDPFPGVVVNRSFYVSTNPAATKDSDGLTAGFAIDSIRLAALGAAVPVTFRLSFGGPALSTSDVVAQLLNGVGRLSVDQARYLDYIGNRNGRFDVGDFRAWVDATGAPATGAVVVPSLTPAGEVRR